MIQERQHVICFRIFPDGTEEVLEIVPHNPEFSRLYNHFSAARLNFWVGGNFQIIATDLKNPEVEVFVNGNGIINGEKPNPKAKKLSQSKYVIYGPALFVMLTK